MISQGAPGWWGYGGDDILPSYIGIITSHYKNPHEPTRIPVGQLITAETWAFKGHTLPRKVVCFATQHSFLQTIHPLNLLVTWILKIGGLGRCFSFSKGVFSGSMLVFGGVFIPSSFVLKLPLNDA